MVPLGVNVVRSVPTCAVLHERAFCVGSTPLSSSPQRIKFSDLRTEVFGTYSAKSSLLSLGSLQLFSCSRRLIDVLSKSISIKQGSDRCIAIFLTSSNQAWLSRNAALMRASRRPLVKEWIPIPPIAPIMATTTINSTRLNPLLWFVFFQKYLFTLSAPQMISSYSLLAQHNPLC